MVIEQFTGDMVIIVFQMQFYRLLLWKMANILRFVVEALYPLDMYWRLHIALRI